jgi:hypothetical protein
MLAINLIFLNSTCTRVSVKEAIEIKKFLTLSNAQNRVNYILNIAWHNYSLLDYDW